MKKTFIICAGLCAVFLFSGCKSKESAYKKAYEKAKAQETVETVTTTQPSAPTVTPLTTTTPTTTVVDNYDNVSARSENVTLVSGAGLRNYSVVVGSFSLKANAEGLQNTLKNAGYPAQIAYNSGNNMYRVVATTFDSKGDAVQSRDQLRGKYPDAWLLFKK